MIRLSNLIDFIYKFKSQLLFRVFHIQEFHHLGFVFSQFLARFLSILKDCYDQMNSIVKCTKYFELTKQLVKYHVGLISQLLYENPVNLI